MDVAIHMIAWSLSRQKHCASARAGLAGSVIQIVASRFLILLQYRLLKLIIRIILAMYVRTCVIISGVVLHVGGSITCVSFSGSAL